MLLCNLGMREDFSEKTGTSYTPLQNHQIWTDQTETFLNHV